MYILGLGGSDHDVSATLIYKDQFVCAIEEERVTRKKYAFHSNLLLGHSRNYVLQAAGISLDDVQLIIADEILASTAFHSVRRRATKLNHHLAHAASTFYPSPFNEAAILIVDNAGGIVNSDRIEGVETVTFAEGSGNAITVTDKVIGDRFQLSPQTIDGKAYQTGDPNNSLGHFYKIISHYCGFDFISNGDFYFTEDGKTMGLAPYGTDRFYTVIRPFIDLLPNGALRIDLHTGDLQAVLKDITSITLDKNESFQRTADIAWAGQKCLEEAMVHLANAAYEKTHSENLCIAGGVGLNSVANGLLLKKTPFKRIFVQPASGDNGTSIGCALWGYYSVQGNQRNLSDGLRMNHAFLGRAYEDVEIRRAFTLFPELCAIRITDPASEGANRLAQGEIVGWFQGGAEFGPRALGHRSILANPTLPSMKDEINRRVKGREEFRPFAPAVLEEEQKKYFDLDQSSPFMLIVCDVLEDYKTKLPAVTHVDGTARVQTVSRDSSPEFYNLIKKFGEITGFPVVLNTSFNVKGEPIVETPEDALRCFRGTNMDSMIMGNFVVSKRKDSE